MAANYAASTEFKEYWRRAEMRPGPGSGTGRAVLERRTVHIPDVLADPGYEMLDAQRVGGFRTILCVPMLREGVVLGVIGALRSRVEPFTEKQIGLVETFADQAVIAIENVRLFKELQARNAEISEALQQQTATAEILKVISSSPTDLQPVFDAILEKATHLCDSHHGALGLFDGVNHQFVAARASDAEVEVVDLLKTFATQSALAIQNARLFREIAEKGRQLEVASQHKSQFLASMSHELRTPLNAILGFNEMMLDGLYGELPEDLKDPLQETQTSGRHLLRLINNVLDLAKIEAGRMELALADYSVEELVESVRSTLRPLAEAKGLEFNIAVPSDIPLAYGDAGRLTQSLMNLAGNSLKFTKAGQVAISVAAKDDVLAFRVVDTGIGIAPEKVDSLFTEFKQTDATIASEYGGTGLGLAITRQFIEMHGGRIWVESEPGKGSTFIFEIPLRAQAT